jgi:hypothetical protein
MPADQVLARVSERTKGITDHTSDIRLRVGHLEKGLGETRVELAAVGTQVVALDSKVDVLVEEAKESRRERLEREQRAEKRAAEELAFRRERTMKLFAIIVPTIAAIGALVAGIISAVNSSGG